ncbi:unnamed protein product [Gadus morhua 'NCC']
MDHPHGQSVEQSLFLGAKTASKQPLLRGSVSYWREGWRRRRRSKENVYCEDGCTSHGSGDLSVTLQSCPATTRAPWGPREEQRQQQPPYGLGGSQLGARRAAAGSSLPTVWVALSWGPAGQQQAAASLRSGWLSAGGPPGSSRQHPPYGLGGSQLGARVRSSGSGLPTGWVALSWGTAGQRQRPPYGLGGSQLGARAAAAAAAASTLPGIHPRQTDNLAGFPLASARRLPDALVAHFMGRSPLINL